MDRISCGRIIVSSACCRFVSLTNMRGLGPCGWLAIGGYRRKVRARFSVGTSPLAVHSAGPPALDSGHIPTCILYKDHIIQWTALSAAEDRKDMLRLTLHRRGSWLRLEPRWRNLLGLRLHQLSEQISTSTERVVSWQRTEIIRCGVCDRIPLVFIFALV